MKKASLTLWLVVMLGLVAAGCSSPVKTAPTGQSQGQPTVAAQGATNIPEQQQTPAAAPNQSTTKQAQQQPAQGQSQPPALEQPAATPAPVTVTTKKVQQDTEAIQVDLSIPVLDGLQDSKLQQQLNSRFEQDALKFENDLEAQAGEDIKEAVKTGNYFWQYDATTAYKVAYNQNGLLSITVDYYRFTDGAHGTTERIPYNYDLATGQELSLQDLFQAGVNYKEIINQEITAQIKTSPIREYLTVPGMEFKTIDDSQPFYLTDGGLVVYFGQYEIAPYVAGMPEFKIPFNLFNGGVQPQFTEGYPL